MSGALQPMECFLFTLLLMLADPESGIWHGSAGLLAALFHLSERTTRDLLEKLERKGYLKRFPIRGKHGSYPILVHRYFCSSGAVKGKWLNAEKTMLWERPVYEVCDENVNEGVNESAGKYLETKRNREKEPTAQSVPPEELAGTLPLVDGTDYSISKSQVVEWKSAYPAIDVKLELQKFKAWLKANPTRRKTRRGIERAIVGWLMRSQDRGPSLNVAAKQSPLAGMTFVNGGHD